MMFSRLAIFTLLFLPTESFQSISMGTTVKPFARPSTRLHARRNLDEFNSILGEVSEETYNQELAIRRQSQQQQQQQQQQQKSQRKTVLVSSTTFPQPGLEADELSSDPYAESAEEVAPQMTKIQQEDNKPTNQLESRLESMDLGDIIVTLLLPSIVAFAGLRWGYNRASTRMNVSVDASLDGFASEMIHHDGNFEEMKLCISAYSKKLLWLGPTKNQAMLKRYLAQYGKRMTVSPQGISSLSYVFSVFKLSEEKAAQVLVSLCRDLGEENVSSSGKLYFFGTRILKSPEGKAALMPIREFIKGTYRESAAAETIVETSQIAMAESAYRATVTAGGKEQSGLTVGWEVLGLDKETATRVFKEERKTGFKTETEKVYGGQSKKYNAKGLEIDKKGNLVNEEDIQAAEEAGDDEEEEEGSVSNVYECQECGYTLFIAKGREDKFYGDGFRCPECGAPKKQFKGRDLDEE